MANVMKRSKEKIKILWLSANLFGYELLKEALKTKGIDFLGIMTLSPKATTKMYDGIDREKWYEFGMPVYEIENINDQEDKIKSLKPDFIIMAGWRQIIDKKIFTIPSKGLIGFHPSLLPKNRGPAPIINTILMGLKKSGLTMFYAADGIDNGDIIGQAEYDIDENDYAFDVYKKIIIAGKSLIRKFLSKLIDGTAPRIVQDENQATYFTKRTLKENEIDLKNETPEEIYRKIKALSYPFNGAYIKLGSKKIIIWKAQLEDEK